MVSASSRLPLDKRAAEELSPGQLAENLGQQIEEVSGLQAICGSDCISSLEEPGSEEPGPSSGSSRINDHVSPDLLEATLLIHVDLPHSHLKLTVRTRAGSHMLPSPSAAVSDACHTDASIWKVNH